MQVGESSDSCTKETGCVGWEKEGEEKREGEEERDEATEESPTMAGRGWSHQGPPSLG